MGRPDLIGSLGHTAEDMAKLMFNTLQTKILTLPDDVQVGNRNIVQCVVILSYVDYCAIRSVLLLIASFFQHECYIVVSQVSAHGRF